MTTLNVSAIGSNNLKCRFCKLYTVGIYQTHCDNCITLFNLKPIEILSMENPFKNNFHIRLFNLVRVKLKILNGELNEA